MEIRPVIASITFALLNVKLEAGIRPDKPELTIEYSII
jgi:hypothetical protein